MNNTYQSLDLNREEVDRLRGNVILQFGTNWCGFCQNAEPIISKTLADRKELQLVKIEDGPGRKLGRSFKIKLWPTLVFLEDGVEFGRVVRPNSAEEIERVLAKK